jgi:bile-acid 7alpha-dehydratase
MTTIEELEARIRKLEDIEAIKQLKYKYWRCLDQKRWDEMAECFTVDATVSYGGGKYRFAGRDRIIEFLRSAMGVESGTIGIHHGHHPEIEITSPTTARGCWALHNYLLNAPQQRGVREGAFYEDAYVKIGGAWKLQHTGYTYVFHEEWSRADTPSIRVSEP